MDAPIEANYEVIKFIEHGSRCRPAMDCVPGELLIYRLKRCPEAEKELVFDWMKQLMRQIELYHRCRSNQCYRYVNPFSVLVTRDDKILLLDLEAESNDFVLRNMQKRAMRNHFVKPIIHIRENTKISLDLYGYGKTIQFILANTNVEPSLTKREENRLERIIEKCLGENPKKQYEDFRQVQKDLPAISNWNQKKRRKWVILAAAAAIVLIASASVVKKREKQEEKVQIQQNIENTKEELYAAETEKSESRQGPEDKMDSLEEETAGLQEYLLRNTAKDNKEIIAQGETLLRELLRCLSAAYDREGMTQEALASYEALCRIETQAELLKSAYLRRITIAMELQDEGKAVQIGKEAIEYFPELKETEVFRKLEKEYGMAEKEDGMAEKEYGMVENEDADEENEDVNEEKEDVNEEKTENPAG